MKQILEKQYYHIKNRIVKIHLNALLDKGNAFPSPLCVKLPQMNTYTKCFDKSNKYINLLVNDKEILKKYSEKWYKIKSLIKKKN